MSTPRERSRYHRPVLTKLGTMREVTRKSFQKPGFKKDPGGEFFNRE